jgi:hypothetical protein
MMSFERHARHVSATKKCKKCQQAGSFVETLVVLLLKRRMDESDKFLL